MNAKITDMANSTKTKEKWQNPQISAFQVYFAQNKSRLSSVSNARFRTFPHSRVAQNGKKCFRDALV
jgi:hypothetical protein